MTDTARRGSPHQRRHRTYAVAATVVVAVAAVAAVIFGVTMGADGAGRDRAVPGSVSSSMAAPAPPVVAELTLPANAGAPVFAAGSGWVAVGVQLMRIDPATNKATVAVKDSGEGSAKVLSAFDSIWFDHELKGLFRVDPRTGAVTARFGEEIGVAAVGFGSLWGMDVNHEVVRVDPSTNKVVARIRVSDKKEETHGCVAPFRATCPDYLTVHQDKIVVFIEGEDAAVHIDPATNRVTKRIKMPADAAGFYGINGQPPWIMTLTGLAQVDLETGNVLAQIALGYEQMVLSYEALAPSIAINGDTAWLVADTITTQLDLKARKVVKTFPTPGAGGVLAAAFGHDDLWVSYDDGTLRRVDLSST